jgi:hypothetical protein
MKTTNHGERNDRKIKINSDWNRIEYKNNPLKDTNEKK